MRQALFIFLISSVLGLSMVSVKKEPQVIIKTEYGNITVKLYNETPLHRDNFLKLTKEGYYTDLLFHRVIQHFMIQGGDPDSKTATPGQLLGDGDLDYLVPAEFNRQLYHKKGVIAAAREGDEINPEKASSACQFYLVQGKVFTVEELKALEEKKRMKWKAEMTNDIFSDKKNKALEKEYADALKADDRNKITELNTKLDELLKKEFGEYADFRFTEEEIKTYTTIGGTPHLDGNYTVFGEIVSGMEVVDKIAAVNSDANDRPFKDVKFSIELN